MFWFKSRGQEDGRKGGGDRQPGPEAKAVDDKLPKAEDLEANPFKISRGLRESLLLCHAHLLDTAEQLANHLAIQSLESCAIFEKMRREESLEPQEIWQLQDFRRNGCRTANLGRVVTLLHQMLHDPTVIGDPTYRRLGELPVQAIVQELRELAADDDDLSSVGQCVSPNGVETVDASLGTLLKNHSSDFDALMKVTSLD